MKDARLELLLECLQAVVEKTTRSLSEIQQSAAGHAFDALERAGASSPGLSELRERQQAWADRFFDGVLRLNRELGEKITGRAAPTSMDEPDDPFDVDGGEEPEDAPELQRPRPRRRSSKPAPAARPRAKATPAAGKASTSKGAKRPRKPRAKR